MRRPVWPSESIPKAAPSFDCSRSSSLRRGYRPGGGTTRSLGRPSRKSWIFSTARSTPLSVNTRTWPIFFSGASATEPVSAGGKSSGTTIFTADSFGIGLVLVGIAGEACVLAEPGRIEQREVQVWRKVYNLAAAQYAG